VELSPGTLELLRGRRRQTGTALVFPTLDGTMRQERTCDTGLRRCARRAGLVPFGWHTLRHTYASHLAMREVPIIVVKELLGHSDIQTTMRYAHVSPAVRTRSVALLDGPPEGVAEEPRGGSPRDRGTRDLGRHSDGLGHSLVIRGGRDR
jgi:integrase